MGLFCPLSFEMTWIMSGINTGLAGITQHLGETLYPPGVANRSYV